MIEKLKGFPFILIFVAYAVYLGFQWNDLQTAPEGPVMQHQVKMKAIHDEVTVMKKKLDEGQKFLKTLDVKKEELRAQVKKLLEFQGALSEALDVPSLVKILLTEAKKIQMKVDRIEPGRRSPKEFYVEQEFKINVKGTYSQIVLFAQRISQLQQILRIESFSIKPSSTATSRTGTQLDGQLSVRGYQYTPSKEDTLARTYQ